MELSKHFLETTFSKRLSKHITFLSTDLLEIWPELLLYGGKRQTPKLLVIINIILKKNDGKNYVL